HQLAQALEAWTRRRQELAARVEPRVLVGDRAQIRAQRKHARQELELLVEQDAVVIVHETSAFDRAPREVNLEAVLRRQALELLIQLGAPAPPPPRKRTQ